MKKFSDPSRLLALSTASVLSVGVMLQAAPARADKAKNYKYGAIALGAVGAYLLSKGKTVEGAAVLGAGAYTYKKGEDARKSDNYGDYRDRYGYRDRYDNNDRYGNNDNRYDAGYDNFGRYDVPARNRLSARNGSSTYRLYRSDDRYRERNDERNDSRYDDRNDDRHRNRNEGNPKIR